MCGAAAVAVMAGVFCIYWKKTGPRGIAPQQTLVEPWSGDNKHAPSSSSSAPGPRNPDVVETF
jgi:hypothetical protein